MAVHVRLLGRPVATSTAGDRELERKAAACVSYLVIEGRQSRDRVADLLWPAAPQGTARSNLRQLARRLRRAAGGAEVLTSGDPVEIDAGVGVDVQLLLVRPDANDWSGVAACNGVLLAGLHFDDCPDLEDWLTLTRTRLARTMAHALSVEAARVEAEQGGSAALPYLLRWLEVDRLSEEAYRRLMRLHFVSGDRGAALRVYDECCTALRGQLDLEPCSETVALALEIRNAPGPQVSPSVLPLPVRVERTASHEKLTDLIGNIYDAPFDPALWPAVVTHIAEALGATYPTLGMHDLAAGLATLIAPRADPEYLRSYHDYWMSRSVLLAHARRVPIGQVMISDRYVSREEFTRTDFYNEWWRPQRIGTSSLGVNLFAEGSAWGMCGFHRTCHNDQFDAKAIAVFKLLAPHLVRAVEVQRRLLRLDLREELTLASLDRQGQGVVLVDGTRRVVYANRPAETLIESGDSLRFEASRLSAVDPSAAATLSRLIAGCAGQSRTPSGPGGTLEIGSRKGSPLRVLVAPFRSRSDRMEIPWLGVSWPAAILFVSDPQRERVDSSPGG